MRVKQLKEAIADLPDHLEVVVRADDDDNDQWIVCGVRHVGINYSHDSNDTPFLAIDASTDVEPEPS